MFPSATPTIASGTTGLHSILGPLLIGPVLSAALWGVTCVQTYDYFSSPKESDRLPQKLIIVFLWILDTLNTAMSIHVVYYYFVTNFTNPEALLAATWSLSSRTLVMALSIFIVRAMYARRIYLLSEKNIIILSWIMTFSTADFALTTLIAVKSLMKLSTLELQNISRLLYASFSLGVASDISVTIALCWFLHSLKTGLRKTDTLVKLLMAYIVTTGLLVSVDASLGLICYVVMPDNLIFTAFFLLLGNLYINAYLASLNAREHLRKSQTDLVISMSTMSYPTRQKTQPTVITEDDTPPSFRRPDNAMSITFETSTERRAGEREVRNSTSSDVV